MSWASRAAKNLLPLSRERHNLARALGEWRYTGEFNDLEELIETCGLCEHPDIRYQFEIENEHTRQTLLIGSECVHRFGIAAVDEHGTRLDALETRKKVDKDRRKLVEEARKRRVVRVLVALAHADEGEFNIASFISYLQDRGAFTPSQLAFLCWRLKARQIAHQPRDFRMIIRRGREKQQLLDLEDWKLKQLLPYMSESQLTFLRSNGKIV